VKEFQDNEKNNLSLRENPQDFRGNPDKKVDCFVAKDDNAPRKDGFTLAEVLITLVIIGVVAAITVPTLITKYHEEQTVSKVTKAYSIVSQAWNRYQIDNNCTGKAANCFNSDSMCDIEGYKKLLKYFNTVKVIPPYSNMTTVGWLPEKSYDIRGNEINDYWSGVHKQDASSCSVYFTLSDGMIFHIHMPDNHKENGIIFFDTNGQKGPNRFGKDQFPIGIGAYRNDKYASKVHPFYVEDSSTLIYGGLCNIREDNECNPDECNQTKCSPTAYVLKNGKLPPITW